MYIYYVLEESESSQSSLPELSDYDEDFDSVDEHSKPVDLVEVMIRSPESKRNIKGVSKSELLMHIVMKI
ncbi:CLUMA_CG006018, isoform A [Clunio marinus]|uniref:CLUMA_CG006018, isoform A n=1 Tax=Clunio marinus TaxID=568069 RepID=A0A1J1HWL3_9DIPT|nr:CLUMA_CG006018, isoform A [Clunio marinus]